MNKSYKIDKIDKINKIINYLLIIILCLVIVYTICQLYNNYKSNFETFITDTTSPNQTDVSSNTITSTTAPNPVIKQTPSYPNTIPSSPNTIPSSPNTIPSSPNTIQSSQNTIPSVNNTIQSSSNKTAITSDVSVPEITSMSIPTDVQTQQCNANMNVAGYCMNYVGCCGKNGGGSIGGNCFCSHPFVLNCKAVYDECGNTQECKDKLKQCCMGYNDINIDVNNFSKPIKQEQKSKILCAINSAKNIDQKCMELCQTHPDCKAYSVNDIGCTLFSGVSPIPNKPNSKAFSDYFIKK